MRRTLIIVALALAATACSDSATPTTSTTTAGITTTSTTTTTATTTTSTVPLPPADDYCRKGEARLIALLARTGVGVEFTEDILFVDAGEQAIVGSMAVDGISGVLTGAVALPDGSTIVTTRQGPVGPGGLFVVTDGTATLIDVRPPNDEVTAITGYRCREDGFIIDIVFGIDDFEGDLVSYRGTYSTPSELEQLWVADGDLVNSTERSPDGRFVAVTAWPVDPVFGPLLRVLDAETGEDISVPFNLGPTFGDDDSLRDFPIGLNWLPDGRLLHFFATPGNLDDPDSVAIDLDTGEIEPWDLNRFLDPNICRFGGIEIATSGNIVIIVDEDTALTLPIDADFVRGTC
ncbi:MAG: hypothetical protein HKN01_10435 [Acidimicrobiia bacterium]|nr:hypothetical protein [Acidimicrobiia bacterium]